MTWAHRDAGEFNVPASDLGLGDRADHLDRTFAGGVPAGWLSRCAVGLAVLVLPVAHRGRYDEEFRSELVELQPRDQLDHALHLLSGCWSLRREVIAAAPHRAPRRHALRRPAISASAAVMVIAFSGVGLAARSTQPGDNLWGVTQVLYSGYARSVEAAASARADLNEAVTALREGKPAQAKASLDRGQQQLPVIAEAEGRTDLTARHRELEQALDTDPPLAGTDPVRRVER